MLTNVTTKQCCGCSSCENYNDCPDLPEEQLPENIKFEFTGKASYLFPAISANFDVPCQPFSHVSINRFRTGDDSISVNEIVPRLVLSDGTRTKEYFKYFPPGQRQTFSISRNQTYKVTLRNPQEGQDSEVGDQTSFDLDYEIVGIYVAPIKTVSKHVNTFNNFNTLDIVSTTKITTEKINIPETAGGPREKKFYKLKHDNKNKCIELGYCPGAYGVNDVPLQFKNDGIEPSRPKKQISSGEKHTLAIKKDGSLWAWGDNSFGQLGDGTTGGFASLPVQVGTSREWASVACGSFSSFAIKRDGSLWAWGKNNKGQLGIGDILDKSEPVKVGESFNTVASGLEHTIAIRFGGEFTEGQVWSWGSNLFGQLGYSGSENVLTPKKITSLTAKAISCGLYHSAAIGVFSTQNEGVYCWGNNEYGQVGVNSSSIQFNTPQKVTFTSDPNYIDPRPGSNIPRFYYGSRIECGGYHTALLAFLHGVAALPTPSNTNLWMWGRNLEGQIGADTPPNTDGEQNELSPVEILPPAENRSFESVGCGKTHTVVTCYYNGPGTNVGDRRISPYSVNFSVMTKLDCGSLTNGNFLARDPNGFYNTHISCGDNFTIFQTLPGIQDVNDLDGITGRYVELLWRYGDNSVGQLGNGLGANWNGSYSNNEPNAYVPGCLPKIFEYTTGLRELTPGTGDTFCRTVFDGACVALAEAICDECKPTAQGGDFDCLEAYLDVEDSFPIKYSGLSWFADIIIQPVKAYNTEWIEPFGYSTFNNKSPLELCGRWFSDINQNPYWARDMGLIDYFFRNGDTTPSGAHTLLEWQRKDKRFTSMKFIGPQNSVKYAGPFGSFSDSANCGSSFLWNEWYGFESQGGSTLNHFLLDLEDFKNSNRSTTAQRIQYLLTTKTDEWTQSIFETTPVPDSYINFAPHAKEFIDSNYTLNPILPITSELFISSPMKQNNLEETVNLSGGNLGLPYGIYKPNIASKSNTYLHPNCKKPCFGNDKCYDSRFCCTPHPECYESACCVTSFEPGCPVNSACEQAVCSADPLCCISWDSQCAFRAQNLAACNCPTPICGNPDSQDCVTCSTNPGCSDPSCCAIVSDLEPHCIQVEWSPCCVELAEFFGCGEPNSSCTLTCEEWRNQNSSGPDSNTGEPADTRPNWCKPYDKFVGYTDSKPGRLENVKWVADGDQAWDIYYSIFKIPQADTIQFRQLWEPDLLGESGLTLWYDASDTKYVDIDASSSVTKLKNKNTYFSTNVRDSIPLNSNAKPKFIINGQNNKSVIEFDGLDHGLISQGVFSPISSGVNSTWSIFVAYKPLPGLNSSGAIFGNESVGNLRVTPNNAGSPNVNEGNILSVTKTLFNRVTGNQYPEPTLENSLNGTRINFSPNSVSVYKSGVSSLWSLGQETDGFNKLKFQLYEIIVHNGNLLPENIQKVEGYLAWKWGLVEKLPNDHLYKKNPPGYGRTNKKDITTAQEQIEINQTCHHPYYSHSCLHTSRPLHEIYSVFPLPPDGVLQYELCNSGDGNATYAYMCRTPKINGEYVLPPLGKNLTLFGCGDNDNENFDMPAFATTDLQIKISPVEPQ
jgi:hypothetical protein